MSGPELVLCVHREELAKQGVGTDGIYPLDIDKVSQSAFGWLPRHIIDNKSESSIQLGYLFPQILGYFQILDVAENKILVYRRKGKEEGLLGKYSIGVGGHVDLSDSISLDFDRYSNKLPFSIDIKVEEYLANIIDKGARRELREELNCGTEEFVYEGIISTLADATSAVHVGLFQTIELSQNQIDGMVLDPSEFPGIEWRSWEELIAMNGQVEFETWSKLLIENKAKKLGL